MSDSLTARRKRDGKVKVEAWIDQSQYDRLIELSGSFRRTIGAEIDYAIARHLDAPPQSIEPPLAPGVQPPEQPKRGRPKQK
jgi:hypothetical protein